MVHITVVVLSFLLNHNNPLFTDRSNFVYGHNMGNGSMFGRLKNYMTDASKDHLFYIYLPDGTRHVYQFFSVATVFQSQKHIRGHLHRMIVI